MGRGVLKLKSWHAREEATLKTLGGTIFERGDRLENPRENLHKEEEEELHAHLFSLSLFLFPSGPHDNPLVFETP